MSAAPAPSASVRRPAVRHRDAPPPGTRLPIHYPQCFGCGADHPTGLRLEVTAEEGVAVSARYTVGERHQGAPGLAHGGLLATALDETMASLFWLLQVPGVTGTLHTEFRRPVPVGSVFRLSARATGIDGRKVYVDAEGRFADEALDAAAGGPAVRASAVFLTVDLDHFRRHGRPEDLAAAPVIPPGDPEPAHVNP